MAEKTEAGRKRGGKQPLAAGEQLRKAREARGLSIQQVAQSLHLDAWILEALEEDRFKDVGAPVFVKGHLRKFAAEVGLSDDDVIEAYYRSENAPETPGLVTETLTRPATDSHGRGPIIAVSLLLLALIAIVVWLWLRQDLPLFGGAQPEQVAVQEAASQSLTEPAFEGIADSGLAPDEEPIQATSTAGEGDGSSPQTSIASSAQGNSQSAEGVLSEQDAPIQPQPAAVADSELRLSIDFAGDSWVEIYDAGNRRLFFDMARGGSTETVSGAPPLQVLLGNAEDVRLTVNGNAFEMPAGARRGRTARFTVQ